MRIGLTQALRRAVQTRPDATALIDGDKRFSWHETGDRIARLGAGLAGLGLQANDRVALLALNSHRSYECYFGALVAGGVMMPLNHRLVEAEILAQILDGAPTILVAGPEFAELALRLQAAAPSILALVLASDAGPVAGFESFEALIAGATAGEDAMRGGDDLACLFYTGGTTGAAKGVMLSHANIIANTANFIGHTGFDERTVHLHCGPLFHVAAGVRLFAITHLAGTHVMLPRFVAGEVLATIAAAGVTLATFVPTMIRALLDEFGEGAHDISSLRYITYGAAPMPEALLREAMGRLPDVRFIQSYGMTETSPIVTMLGWRDHLADAPPGRLRSAGKAALLAEIAVLDAAARPLPTGECGEIVTRGSMVMLGYWNRPGATAEALRGGWFHTGDVGWLDEDGYLYVVDRMKDVIISGGENVYSQEVENAIAAHPAVLQCAVFGRPDERWGEAVHAVVVLRHGESATAAELTAHCRRLIAGFKCPRSIELRSEPLPLSGANKILKVELRNALLAGEVMA